MTKSPIGPNFANEIAAAGLSGLPFAWGDDGEIHFDAAMTPEQIEGVNAVYAAHDPKKTDPHQTYVDAIRSGLAVSSGAAPTLNGTYGTTPQDEINMTGLLVAVSSNVFPGYCRDISGMRRAMTPTQFTALAGAVLDYVATLDAARNLALEGGVASWPSASVAID